MKRYKTVVFFTLSIVMLSSLTQCKCSKESTTMGKAQSTSHSQQTDEIGQTNEGDENQVTQVRGKQMPLFIRDTYFQRSISGKEEGGSGINIYFPTLINKSNYKLEKVYFRGMIGEMQSGKASHFANLKSNKVGLIMSNEDKAEYGNTVPTKPEPFPFELKDNECMISYLDNGETKYFQVYNIVEKAAKYYPSAPPKQNKD